MSYVCQIGDMIKNDWPDPSKIRHFFLNYKEEEWSFGGASGADFRCYGACGTKDKDVENGRIDVCLALVDLPNRGVYVHFYKYSSSFREDYFCLWDKSLLGENFYSRHDEVFSSALVIPFVKAFEVVTNPAHANQYNTYRNNYWEERAKDFK